MFNCACKCNSIGNKSVKNSLIRNIHQLNSHNCTPNDWSIMNSLKLFLCPFFIFSPTQKLLVKKKSHLSPWHTKFNFYLPFHYRLFIYQSRCFGTATTFQFEEINWYIFLPFATILSRVFSTAAAVVAWRERETFISFKLNKKLFYAKSETLLRSGMFHAIFFSAVIFSPADLKAI